MSEVGVEKDILDEVRGLKAAQQRRVLEFARSVARSELRGVSGKSLLKHVGAIGGDDLQEIARAVHEDCERVEPSEW